MFGVLNRGSRPAGRALPTHATGWVEPNQCVKKTRSRLMPIHWFQASILLGSSVRPTSRWWISCAITSCTTNPA